MPALLPSHSVNRVRQLALFVFGSGLCALIYQVTWMREFRLVFGATTAATAAVLGIFIGGLGFGGLWFGPRADRHPNPLRFYAQLEAAIALSAALTPLLLWLIRTVYIALRGTVALGAVGGTLLRLVLSTLVLAVPTLLMGGTLPAAAHAVETDQDEERRGVALLYGVNTLGAVAGSVLTTFFLLETAGTRLTLWLGAFLNLAVAGAAWHASRISVPGGTHTAGQTAASPSSGSSSSGGRRSSSGRRDGRQPGNVPATPAPAWFVLLAAGVVGFAFFLMEIVWYRMLTPLFGGTVFTFGLILAVALLGIGLGGAAYAIFGSRRRASLEAFAVTCLLQAAAVAFPYALGDRLAVLTLQLRPAGPAAISASLTNWFLITAIVVFPAALVAGYQFPLLIALLGRGRTAVGRQVGQAYACNTLGAILGSLAGGFGCLPLLGADGCWLLVALLLAVLGLASVALAGVGQPVAVRRLAPAGLACLIVPAVVLPGPTAAWRHSAIGAGRESLQNRSPNDVQRWLNAKRRVTVWEKEGVESSIAMEAQSGISLIVNGKNDSNARTDAATTIMLGILGAILHPEPRTAAVVGLGTGTTAGWLGAVPGMERVDVVELEPAVLEVARACAPVNHDVMNNPRVQVLIGDAREVLPASRARYDLIVSEPSNPFRAGIATLFTREYYQAMAARLNEGGLFLQWVQAYEIDERTMSTIYATLSSVFPNVEVWQIHAADTILVASAGPRTYDVDLLRDRLGQEPFQSALEYAWRTQGVEGLLVHFVAGTPTVREQAARAPHLNTDDRTAIEFGFARTLGTPNRPNLGEMRRRAQTLGDGRPSLKGEEQVDWGRVDEERVLVYTSSGFPPDAVDLTDPAALSRMEAQVAFLQENHAQVLAAWRRQSREPSGTLELAMLAEALAEAGDEKAVPYINRLRETYQPEADAILGRLRLRQQRYMEATDALVAAFSGYRENPWPMTRIMRPALTQLKFLAASAPESGPGLFAALKEPFAVYLLNEERLETLHRIGVLVPPQEVVASVLEPLASHPLWQKDLLEFRLNCYRALRHPRTSDAEADLQRYLATER